MIYPQKILLTFLVLFPGILNYAYAETLVVTGTLESGERFGSGLTSGDYNNDGHPDLIVRTSYEVGNSAAINVIFGGRNSDGRLKTANNYQLLMEHFTGVVEYSSLFASQMVSADFNNDGYDDVAMSAPYSNLHAEEGGVVVVAYGAAQGIVTSGNDRWGLGDKSNGRHFGKAVAAGDFNRDGYADLAAATKGSDGHIYILFGTSSGLSANNFQVITKDMSDPYSELGDEMTTGDFSGDGYDDLAIGTPYADVGSAYSGGRVNVYYGRNGGLNVGSPHIITQDSPGIQGVAETSDNFGNALASGDFDNDGYDDLAIGARGEAIGSIYAAGAVNVIFGSSSGLSQRDQIWHQDSSGIQGGCEAYDYFGTTLAAGDFNADGKDDLAIGVEAEKISGEFHAGAVNIILGSSSGLTSSNNYMIHQDKTGVSGGAEASDNFGAYLIATDINSDGRSELVVGVPDEDLSNNTLANAGAAQVLYFESFSTSSPVQSDQFVQQ